MWYRYQITLCVALATTTIFGRYAPSPRTNSLDEKQFSEFSAIPPSRIALASWIVPKSPTWSYKISRLWAQTKVEPSMYCCSRSFVVKWVGLEKWLLVQWKKRPVDKPNTTCESRSLPMVFNYLFLLVASGPNKITFTKVKNYFDKSSHNCSNFALHLNIMYQYVDCCTWRAESKCIVLLTTDTVAFWSGSVRSTGPITTESIQRNHKLNIAR